MSDTSSICNGSVQEIRLIYLVVFQNITLKSCRVKRVHQSLTKTICIPEHFAVFFKNIFEKIISFEEKYIFLTRG